MSARTLDRGQLAKEWLNYSHDVVISDEAQDLVPSVSRFVRQPSCMDTARAAARAVRG